MHVKVSSAILNETKLILSLKLLDQPKKVQTSDIKEAIWKSQHHLHLLSFQHLTSAELPSLSAL